MTTILLIRHGINDFVGKRLAGRLPEVHLNEAGKRQAFKIAQALCLAPFKAIYSSPLERAIETAGPLAELRQMPVQVHSGLLEVDFGEWQGKSIAQLRRSRLWKTVQQKPSEMTFPGGESFQQAQQRIASTLEEIAGQHDERDLVACFSHSDTIRLAVAYFLSMPLDSFQRVGIDTASITTIFLHKEKVFVAAVNHQIGIEGYLPPTHSEKTGALKKNAR